MKKIGYVFMITMICFLFIGCGKNQSNIQEPLSDVMKKLYENISEDEMPLLETVEVTKENQEYYLGNVSFNYQEALASEPVMSSIAHSVVLIRLKDTKNIESIKKEIKEKSESLKGSITSQGTTPRRYTDLLGSLSDLTSGSGDKGTPVVLIKNYFKNYAD